ncbi:MAG: alpha/beta fold hydrolase, partial [Pseudomonadota bacterium]
ETPGVEDGARRRASFYLRQYVDSQAPPNFAPTNPEAVRRAAETSGESLLRGFGTMLDDLERGGGELRPQTNDEAAFTLGVDIAVTPGAVVARTDLAELIQYAPSTKMVDAAPVLIIPPWINKFYVLDLRPDNSFIRWLVAQGRTVFVLSWANPGPELRHKDFEDYMTEGPLAALEAISDIVGPEPVDLIGYCLGGTLLAATLAYRAAMGEPPARSATFLTTMLDFSEPGDLGVFIDEEQLEILEAHMERHGFLDGRHMQRVFSLLRDRDMIWSVYINNYLLGRSPRAFDLLYWNNDSTRMPQMMHQFYLRGMYLENQLAQPGGLTLRGRPIDLARIETPAVFVSAVDDHIAPWRSTFAGANLLGAAPRFLLVESGHVSGVINPPTGREKYGWFDNPNPPAGDADAWLADARKESGSWWPAWLAAIRAADDRAQVKARAVGTKARPALADAPGDYVRVRH